MYRWISRRFALSEKGARDFCRGVAWSTVFDLTLMLPAVLVFLFLDDWLAPVVTPAAAPGPPWTYYALLGLACLLVMYVVGTFQYRSVYTSVYDESANRRVALAEKLRRLPLAFFGEKDLADLTSTIMEDCTDLEHTFSHSVPQLFASLLSLALVAVGMAFYAWPLALALFWVVPVALGILLLARRGMRSANRLNYANRRAVSDHIQEGLEGMQEVKACGREADYLAELNHRIDRYESEQTRGELWLGVVVNGSQALLKLGLATLILTGATLLSAGHVSLLAYLVFLVVGTRVYAPVNEVLNNLAALSFLDVRIRRMRQMEEMPVQHGTTDFAPRGYDIAFRHVSFAYEADRPVLTDVSFTARQGEVTALVGPSGGGKSTAARLAARFWDVQSGSVTLGGVDLSTVDPETLLRHFAIVFQDVVLFNASVMDNIRVGRRGASDEEVRRVARLACCDEFVSRLPEGYATVIGENGARLSGGERQRISIARALLKDAPIVLLDEATASLDVESETQVQAGLSRLVAGRTVLLIAHRMRTVAQADHVVVLAGGTVAESGTPAELLRRSGLFARMARQQSAPPVAEG